MADYYKTRESVSEYIRMAKDVSGAALIDQLRPFISPESRFLELGSGPGTDWKILSKDFEVVGSDNSMEFLQHLKTIHPNGTFWELPATTIETTEMFDAIYSNKVLHHLRDEELRQSIVRQHEVLHPEGVICHSFWKGEGSEIFKGLFVNYHDEPSLSTFLGPQFDPICFLTYQEFEKDDSLLLIARKK